jgi:hypothetical protein
MNKKKFTPYNTLGIGQIELLEDMDHILLNYTLFLDQSFLIQ